MHAWLEYLGLGYLRRLESLVGEEKDVLHRQGA